MKHEAEAQASLIGSTNERSTKTDQLHLPPSFQPCYVVICFPSLSLVALLHVWSPADLAGLILQTYRFAASLLGQSRNLLCSNDTYAMDLLQHGYSPTTLEPEAAWCPRMGIARGREECRIFSVEAGNDRTLSGHTRICTRN
jgi:hypothetical protein